MQRSKTFMAKPDAQQFRKSLQVSQGSTTDILDRLREHREFEHSRYYVSEPRQCQVITRLDVQCSRDAKRVLGDTVMCDKHFKQIYDDAIELETSRLDRFGKTIQDRAVQQVLEFLRAELVALDRSPLRPRTSEENSVVYYGEVGGGLIKIGTTTNLAQRERTLYMRTLAFETGGPQKEAMRHRQFAEERVTKDGELFHRSERLMTWIEEVKRLRQESIDGA